MAGRVVVKVICGSYAIPASTGERSAILNRDFGNVAALAWINARTVAVFEARDFAKDASHYRCYVIAGARYEWTGNRAPRQLSLFERVDGQSFASAGIWTDRKVVDVAIELCDPDNGCG